MKTLQEDIDDLDRMVDTGATKDAIRSQIRLIAREVAALQTDNVSLFEAHAKLQKTKEEADLLAADTKSHDEKAMLDSLDPQNKKQAEARRRSSLH